MSLRCSNENCESRIKGFDPHFTVNVIVNCHRDLAEKFDKKHWDAPCFNCNLCGWDAEESPKQSDIKSESRVKFEGSERYQVKIDGGIAGYVSREDSYGHLEGDLEYNHTDGCTYLCQIQSAETLDEVRRQLEEIIYGDFEDL